MGRRFRRWRRRAFAALLVGICLFLLVVAAAWAALQFPGVRTSILDTIDTELARYGLRANASDFRVDFLRGRIEVYDVRLAATDPGAPPFLTVARASARLHWSSLFSGRPVFDRGEVERPRFDLDAPLPRGRRDSGPGGAGDEGPVDAGVEVLDAHVWGGEVTVADVPPDLRPWAESARADRVEARASLHGGLVRVESATGRLTLRSEARPPIVAEVAGALSVRIDGNVAVDSFDIRGDGVEARGSGRINPSETSTYETTLVADLDAGKLFPDLTPKGELHVDGSLTVVDAPDEPTTWRGKLEARADAFPAVLLRPWLDAQLGSSFDASGTLLGGETSLQFDMGGGSDLANLVIRRLAGNGKASWTRGTEVLARVAVDVADSDAAADAIELRFDAAVLPASRGSRGISGTLGLRTGAPLVETTFHDVRVRVDEADPEITARRLGFRPDVLRDTLPEGDWLATLDLDGSLAAFRARGEIRWAVERETMADLRIDATPARGKGTEAAVDFTLLPGRPGTRTVRIEAFVPPREVLRDLLLRRATARVELADASAEVDMLSRFVALVLPRPTALGVLAWLDQFRLSGIVGPLTVEADAAGKLDRLDAIALVTWFPAEDESLRAEASGLVSAFDPLGQSTGGAVVDIGGLRLSRVLRVVEAFRPTATPEGAAAVETPATTLEGPGRPPSRQIELPDVEARIHASSRITRTRDGLSAVFDASSPRVDLPDDLALSDVHLVGRTDGESVEWTRIETTFEAPPLGSSGDPVRVSVRGSGRTVADWPPAPADLTLAGETSFAGLEHWSAGVQLDGGTLRVDPLRITDTGESGTLVAQVPLGSLLDLTPVIRSAGFEADAGPLVTSFQSFEIAPWVDLLDAEDELPPVSAKISGNLTIDPARPADATGSVEVRDVALTLEDGPIELAEGPRFDLGEGRIVLARTRVRAQAPWFTAPTEADVSAVVQLTRSWRPGDPWTSLLADLDVKWNGLAPVSLLELWVPGRGRGMVDVDLTAKGTLEAPVATIAVRGPNAEYRLAGSVPTKLESPDGQATADAGTIRVDPTRVRINGGTCQVSGTIDRQTGVRLMADCSSVRYRLQYGVTVSLGGHLELRWPWTGRRRLEGDLVVERAVLRRDVDLDRELLRAVLEPAVATGLATSSEPIELDLSVTTDEGLQIKNNLADLHAQWGRVEINGTLDEPRLSGRVDIDPGGRVVLPGQTLRIDEGSLSWSGDSPSDPRIQLQTTSSLVDPSIQRNWGSDWYDMGQLGPGRGGALDFASRQQAATSEFVSALGTGVLTHYQSRLAGSVTRGLGATLISYEPLPLFGETDVQARFTVAQDMTKYLTFIASTDPRSAEAQTYIADVHALPTSPSLQAQLFTNDQKNAGFTLQQKLRLGRGSGETREGPRLGSVVFEAPEDVPVKKVRRAIEYRKGDPFAEGAVLDVEVDAAEALRRKGFPGADVQARIVPVTDDRVDVHVSIEPGPRVRFEFVGEKLPKPSRQAVVAQYRPSVEADAESFEGVFQETHRALRAIGFLEPQVDIEVLPASPDTEGVRVVRVYTKGGRKVEPGPPVFEGVPPEVSDVLSSLFQSELGRVELAAAVPDADAFLVQSLQALGYPSPGIVSRSLSDDGTLLRVVIDPGPREVVDSIEIVGVDAEDEAALREVLGIAPGDPARRDRIVSSSAAMEALLRARGHAEANVDSSLETDADGTGRSVLRYQVEPGPLYELDDVHYEGLRASRPKWVAHMAGLDTDEPLRQDDIAEARSRLYRTGVFRRIRVKMDPAIGRHSGSNGDAPGSNGSAPGLPVNTTATFQLEEAPRYQLSYGGRWESSEGIGVAVDAIDRNSFGRGHVSGVRAVLSRDNQSLRFYHAIPRVFGPRNRLELFLEGKREFLEQGVLQRQADAWIQLTVPVTARTQTRVYVRARKIQLSQFELDPDAPPLDERIASPLLGWQFVYDTSLRPLGQTRRGVFAGLDLSVASKSLGSDISSIGLFDQLKFFVPLSGGENPRFSWAQSWRTSIVSAQDEPVPYADRLFLGGEYSVRGYPTDSLGPIGPDGLVLGGQYLFIVNQELHGRVFGPVTGLLFFDAGNVWENRESIDANLFHSWGVGARYLSPVGPLRLDFAFPLDRRPEDSEYTVYFGFGNVF